MFHLQACVHFKEIVIQLFVYNKFYCACTAIIHCFGSCNSKIPHFFPDLRCHQRGRCFFHHFLMAALDRALPFEKMNYIAMRVAKDLKFDMVG